MKRRPLVFLLTALSVALQLVLPRAVAAQDEKDSPLAERIDAVVRGAGVAQNAPGVAVLVIKDGKEVYKQARGLASVADKRAITPQTTFELASCSKQFTGLATILLLERGLISQDDEVRKHIPELPEYSAEKPVLVRHLVHHTSGIPDYLEFEMDVELEKAAKGGRKFLTNDDCVQVLVRHSPMRGQAFSTGERFEYSNSNYMLLAAILERVTKKSYGEFLRDEVFSPLGMKTAAVNERPDAKIAEPAFGYQENDSGGFDITWGAPPHRLETLLSTGDGAVWCSLDDLAAFDRGLRSGKLLALDKLTRYLKPIKTKNGDANDYAFGWRVETDDAGKLVSLAHSGSWAGFRSECRLNLGGGYTIVVLANRPGIHIVALCDEIEALVAD